MLSWIKRVYYRIRATCLRKRFIKKYGMSPDEAIKSYGKDCIICFKRAEKLPSYPIHLDDSKTALKWNGKDSIKWYGMEFTLKKDVKYTGEE